MFGTEAAVIGRDELKDTWTTFERCGTVTCSFFINAFTTAVLGPPAAADLPISTPDVISSPAAGTSGAPATNSANRL